MPLRICIQSRHLGFRGGLEKWTRAIAHGFKDKGASITLLTEDREQLPDFNHEQLRPKGLFSYQKLKGFDKLCKSWQAAHKPNLIFGVDRTTSQTHYRAGNGVHAAYLQKRQSYENYPSFRSQFHPLNHTILKMEKEAFESPQLRLLITNSMMVKTEILSHYMLPPEKIKVIHNGAEWEEMEPSFNASLAQKEAVAQRLGLDPSAYHLLFAGNGYQRKGLLFLLNGLAEMKRKDLHLSVVGKESKMKKYQKAACALGLSQNVHFFGSQPSLIPFYQLSDAIVIPSIYDPFANVTVEALAMGLFVISSPHNGGCEILTEQNGMTLDSLRNRDAMMFAIEKAMSQPKTAKRSALIRESVKELSFSKQIRALVKESLSAL